MSSYSYKPLVPNNNLLGAPKDSPLSFDAYPNNLLILFASCCAIIHQEAGFVSQEIIREYFHTIYYCKSGCGRVKIKNKIYEIHRGDLFIIHRSNPYVLYADAENPWKMVYIGVQGPGAERLTRCAPVYQYKADTFFRLENAIKNEIHSQELYLSFLYEIFYYLFQGQSEKIDFAKWINNYIHLEYPNKISIEDVAKKLHRNRCYLSQLYKETYGISIKEAIIRVRMKKAVELLQEGYSVSETGKMVGYPDAFSFSRMFSKVMGTPPSQIAQKDDHSK